ncbi:hypothetical protein [Actinoplanes sp. NPDC026619]|uniref:hypothetical protein n=1 Tax=Actinoplanes sp. NPDC026619 TaxID=3155798 RepID=UPI003403AC64
MIVDAAAYAERMSWEWPDAESGQPPSQGREWEVELLSRLRADLSSRQDDGCRQNYNVAVSGRFSVGKSM